MSDIINSHPDHNPLHRSARNTALLLLSGVVIGGAMMHSIGNDHLDEAEALKTREVAVARAAGFTAMLYDGEQYPKGVMIPVLNGEIDASTISVSGARTTRTSYRDPILLATTDDGQAPDAKGAFLEGAYIGVQGNDANGHVKITAVPYNSETNTFKAYDASRLLFQNMGVYATVTKMDENPKLDILAGFDVTGERIIKNPDGSNVTPGQSVAMK